MKKINSFLLILIFVISITGCSRAPWIIKSDPPGQRIDKNTYSIQLTPTGMGTYGYIAFDLTIENKTDSDIELVWDRTSYLQGGQTTGGFMFEGILYKDRNEPKQSDFLFPQKTFSKTIYPSIYANFNNGWYHNPMPNGENGIYLSLKHKGVELREKLIVNLFAGYDESQRTKTVWGKLLNKE